MYMHWNDNNAASVLHLGIIFENTDDALAHAAAWRADRGVILVVTPKVVRYSDRTVESSLLSPDESIGAFITDGDSFTEWGEETTDRDHEALHVTLVLGIEPSKGTASIVRGAYALLEQALRDQGVAARLVDYAVFTNAHTWSEDSHTFGVYA